MSRPARTLRLAVVMAAAAAIVALPAYAAPSTAVHVSHCPSTLGVKERLPAPPASLHPSLTQAQAASLQGYSNGYLTLLAPAGWSCRGQIGADGSGSLFVTPSGSTHPTQPAVTLRYADTPGVAADVGCPFFAAARRQLPGIPCPARAPSKEVIETLGNGTVAFEDPSGVHGDGLPSGGSDPANGVAAFKASSRTVDGYALIVTCTLPAASHAQCTAILNNIYGTAR